MYINKSILFLTIRPPLSSTRTDTRFPYTTLFRSRGQRDCRLRQRFRATRRRPRRPNRDRSLAARVAGRFRASVSDRQHPRRRGFHLRSGVGALRSEEHTPELQSLIRISYAVFCLKKKKNTLIVYPNFYYLHT